MSFDFNTYSTPLLFGFVQGWVYAFLFWLRAWKQERLSDALFGCLLFAFTFDIWEYMLGFGGVDILWSELEFFPRNFSFLLPSLVYLYLKSQFNADFRLRWRDAWHLLPFGLHCLYHIAVYLQGAVFVENWKTQVHNGMGINQAEMVILFGLQMVYFVRALRLYREYRKWAPSQFSDTEAVSFTWFRNFLIAYLSANLLSWGMTLVDMWLDLDFWHDWWDELFIAGLIYYLGITAYAQVQPRRLHFDPDPPPVAKSEKIGDEEMQGIKTRLEKLLRDERVYLEPELTLPDLAQRLNSNASVVSAVVNTAFGKNFNDFINEYRVEAVKNMMSDPANSHLSLLGIAMECGFNSKSTFNRAFRKVTGMAPREWNG